MTRRLSERILCVALMILCLPCARLRAELLVEETFSDGGRTNGADARDSAWFTIDAPGTALAVVDDTAGIGAGNALRLSPTTTSQGLTAMLPYLVTLEDGEVLRLSFTYRFTGTTNLNQGGRLRFGLYNSWGTPTTSDANDVVRPNDDGYYAGTNPGSNNTAGTTLARESNGSELTMSGGATGIGVAGASVSGGTTAHAAVFTVTRSGNSIVVSASIDGQTAAAATDTEPVTTSFDEIAITFGIAAPPSPMLIDNVTVEYLRPGLGDGFTDGSRTDNGADPDDTAWYSTGVAGSALSVVSDAVIGSGNAIKLTATSNSQGLVGRLPSSISLDDGESISLVFDWRFTGTVNINQAARLRFGLYNAGGTHTTSDANTTTRGNDAGYYGQTNPGLSSATGTSLVREASGNELLGGTGASTIGGTGGSVNGGTAAHTAYLTITRSGSTLVATVSIDGQPAATGTDSSPLTYTFDEVAFSIGLGNYTTPSPLVIDNVEVTLTSANAIGGGTVDNPAQGPAPAYGIGGAGTVLVKNWDFGTGGNITNMTKLSEHFQYHDQFNTFNVGGQYGASSVAPNALNAIAGQPVEGTNTGGLPVREFFANSLKTYLVPLNGATTMVPSSHNTGSGSIQAKWKLPNGGSLLNKDIIWETRVRYVTPRYFWFSLWTSGNLWNHGAEMDLVESFGYDNGGTFTNFDGRYWHSNGVGGTEVSSYSSWSSTMASYGITSYDATQYHIWTWHYRADNTYTAYVDGIQVQSGSMNWTNGGGATDTPIDMSFIFDAGWGHTDVSGVNHTLPASELTGKYYEFDYSRVYLK
ncbi:MAG: hypothetical protein ACAH89_02905 [Rariglobus sp.]|nr:hypothetical protein [Rariglobus sp.]